MVQSLQQYRVKKGDFFPESRLGIQTEYFECPVCMNITGDILECPQCHARACESCLIAFGSSKAALSEQDKLQKNLPCSQCLVKNKMQTPNKIMQYLLMNTIRFNCDKCQRHWLFPEFRVHKMRGQCVLDPMAENSIDKLKGNVNNNEGQVQRRQTVVQ